MAADRSFPWSPSPATMAIIRAPIRFASALVPLYSLLEWVCRTLNRRNLLRVLHFRSRIDLLYVMGLAYSYLEAVSTIFDYWLDIGFLAFFG